MSFKSEIQKHIWQDFSLNRIVVPPLMITAVLALIFLSADNPYSVTSYVSFTFYFVINFLWGGYLVAGAITYEMQNGTWDNHRISPVSPWSITFGKLFGSTLYIWCISAVLLIIGSFAALFMSRNAISLVDVMTLILCGFLCHCVTLLVSMQSINSNSSFKGRNTKFSAITALTVGLLTSLAFYLQKSSHIPTITWFNMTFNRNYFLIICICIFVAWAIVAIYRLMREELMFKNIPWIWAAFVVFVMFFASGFFMQSHHLSSIHSSLNNSSLNLAQHLSFSLFFSIFSVYLMLFLESLNITQYKKLALNLKTKDLKKIGECMPKWMVSLVITLLVGIAFCIASRKMAGTLFVISLFFFILRDACIIHFFKLSPKNKKRSGFSILLCFAVIYGLIPSLAAALKLPYIAAFFFPVMEMESTVLSTLPAAINLLVASGFLHMKWKQLK